MERPDAYCLPLCAPLYRAPPFLRRSCPLLIGVFRSEPDALARLVPPPLEPNPDGEVVLIAGRMNVPGLVSFHEVILGVPAAFGERTGTFCLVTYVDEDVPLAGGREIYGWPKKTARIVMRETATGVEVAAERAGTTIVTAAMTFDHEVAEALERHRVWFNVKLIPSVADAADPEVMQLTACSFAGLGTRRMRVGLLDVVLGRSAADPLSELLPVVDVRTGSYGRLDFEIGYGEVLHDYRAIDTEPRPTRPI